MFTAADLDLPPARAMGGDGALDRPLLARERVRFVGEPVAVVVAATRAAGVRRGRARRDRAATARRRDRRVRRRSNRMRRCCSPSSARTRRRAAGPPSAARVGPTPRSSSAPGSSTTASRPCRWSRTAASSSPRVTRIDRVGEHAVGLRRATRDRGRARTRCEPGLGARAGRRRRLRRQGRRVRRAAARRGAGATTRSADRVVRDAAREPPEHDPRPRSGPRRRDRGAARRHDRRASGPRGRRTSAPIRSAVRSSRWSRGSWPRAPTGSRRSSSTRCIVLTNTTPTGPYRGAGRPEAAALLERSIDVLASVLDLDPVDVRRRNFIPPDAFPYHDARRARRTTPATTRARSTRRSRVSDYDDWRARASGAARAW